MAATAATTPAQDDVLSATEDWAARFLEADRVWDTEFDCEKPPEEQGEAVKAAIADHELALARLSEDRASTLRDLGTEVAVALALLRVECNEERMRPLLAAVPTDLRLMELREATPTPD
jgi:hypothetical protein